MEESRAPVPAAPFLIQQSLGTVLCRAQQEPVLSQGDGACQGQRGARDEHVQSKEKHIVLAGVSLEWM